MDLEPNKEAEFTGVFMAHWEAAGIQVEVGKSLFGLLPRREYWEAEFPSDFKIPCFDTSRQFRIRFTGAPSDLGRFGHMGVCCRRVRVRQVLEFVEIAR